MKWRWVAGHPFQPPCYVRTHNYTDPQEFITSQMERFEIDSVTVILVWPQGNPLHSYPVFVLPHVEVTFLGKVRAQLQRFSKILQHK